MSGCDVVSVDVKAERNEEKQVGEGAVPATAAAAVSVRGPGGPNRPEPPTLRASRKARAVPEEKGAGSTRAALKLGNAAQAFEPLLSEDDVIDLLGLGSRKNPRSALLWLMRNHRLAYYQLAKGINGFSREDVGRFLAERRVPTRDEAAGYVAGQGPRGQ